MMLLFIGATMYFFPHMAPVIFIFAGLFLLIVGYPKGE